MLHSFRRENIFSYDESCEKYPLFEKIINDKETGGIKACINSILPNSSIFESSDFIEYTLYFLEFYPECPGLLMLSTLSDKLSNDEEIRLMKQNFNISIDLAFNKYCIDKNIIFDFIAWAIENVKNKNMRIAKGLSEELIQKYSDRRLARRLLKKLPSDFNSESAWLLLNILYKRCSQLLTLDGGKDGKRNREFS